MSLSRGVEGTTGANSGNIGLSSLLSSASAVAGQLAIVSVDSDSSAASFPAGWTVWFSQEVNTSAAAYGVIAAKVLVSGDISGSEIVSVTGGWNVTVTTYGGVAPKVDTGSAAFGYVIAPSASASIGGVVATPTNPNEWLVGIVFGSSNASPSVTGSTTLTEWVNGNTANAFAVTHFDSDGTVAQSTFTETFKASSSGSNTWAGVLLCLTDTSAPSAPTLLAPSSGSYVDMTANVVFSATYNSTDSQNQNAYAFRIKVSGGSYNFWSATTSALQGTIVWNAISTAPGANFTLTLPGGTETNGYTYDWNFASQEAGGNLQGLFAGSDFVLVGQIAPSLTVNSPTGTISTSAPTVAWTTTPASGSYQTQYEVIIYTAAQQAIGGFVPGVSPSTWDSTQVTSSNQSVAVGTALANLTTYYAYVQVAQTGGELSAWEYTSFTTQFDQPNAPGLTVSGGTDPNGVPCMIIAVQGYDNLLSIADSSMSSSATWTWVAGANTAISPSTTVVDSGNAASLKLVATTAGSILATTTTTAYTVIPSATYTATAAFHAATTARACTVSVKWYTVGGSLISTTTSTGVNDSSASATWTAVSENVTAPASASYAQIVVTVAASSGSADFHYVASVGLMPGTGTAWDLGGFSGASQLTLERSDGVYVRGAGYSTNFPLPTTGQNTTSIPGSTQMKIVYDYEAIPETEYTYSGIVTFSAGFGTVSSNVTISNQAEFTPANWWYIEPLTPSASLQMSVVKFDSTQYEAIAVHYPVQPVGVPTPPTTVSGGIFPPDGTLTVQTQSQAQYAALQVEISNGTVKWLISPQGSGAYVRESAANPIGGSAGSAQETSVTPGFAATPYRTSVLTYVAASRP